jgi:HAD superfamily hydrolase (TIGR01509 family)
VPTTRENTLPARTFWWDRARPIDADVYPLRAVIFDLDGTLADVERDGHRVAFNAAFAEHGLDIVWSVDEYGRLLRFADGQRRIAASLRKRGFGKAADELAGPIHRTKTTLFAEGILDGDLTPRAGLIDLVMSLFVAGIWVAVVTNGRRVWAEPLVRQLVGEGIVETVVTGDDVSRYQPDPEVYLRVLGELGLNSESVLAVQSSASGLRAAVNAGLPTVVVTTDYTAGQNFSGAAAVFDAYDGAKPLIAAGCERLHRRWWADKMRSAVCHQRVS